MSGSLRSIADFTGILFSDWVFPGDQRQQREGVSVVIADALTHLPTPRVTRPLSFKGQTLVRVSQLASSGVHEQYEFTAQTEGSWSPYVIIGIWKPTKSDSRTTSIDYYYVFSKAIWDAGSSYRLN